MKFFLSALLALSFTAASANAKDLVVVVGGTGQSGIEVIKQLQADDAYDVRATTRNVEHAKETHGEDIDWVSMEVQDVDQIRAAFKGADFIISTIGARTARGPNGPEYVDYGGVKNIVGVAKDYGVKQFVLMSAASAGKTDHMLNVAVNNVLIWKWLGEDYLRDSGMPYTVIRPVALRNEPRGLRGVTFATMGNYDLGYIARADAAAIMIDSLQNPAALNKSIEIIGSDDVEAEQWKTLYASIPTDLKPLDTGEFSDGQ